LEAEKMVVFENVSFTYKNGEQKNGIYDINLSIGKGEVVVLCGESGCGKTTITRLVNGLIPNYYEGSLSGQVLLGGRVVHTMPIYETAKIVGSVFQNPRSQFFNVDTTSEIAFGCENMGLPEKEIEKRIKDTIIDFKIETLMDRNIFHLSGGEKQKVACASVYADMPDIFVLDEPSSNLDAASIEELRRIIGIWKSRGKTIIIAEHRLYYLRELADQLIYLKDGRIENEFSAERIKNITAQSLSEMGLRALKLEELKGRERSFVEKVECLHLYDFFFSYKNGYQAMAIEQLQIPKNTVIAVVGENGAGKSTFARCLCGLEKRCNGVLENSGTIYKRRKRLKSCYMVMQDVNHQLFAESVLDEVLLGMDKKDVGKAENILESLDLLQLKNLHPMSLSGGQKQRVAIAGAIASKREIIVFDEPTSGLDLLHMKEVSVNIDRLCQMGKTVFIISHDLELIFECCTQVLYFKKGNAEGPYPLDVKEERKLISFFEINNYETMQGVN
jgi:energy-coupling factor transporter ATP-binding protein EcfA2